MNQPEQECVAGSERRNQNTCGSDGPAGSVARARWTLLRQVLRQKQVDGPDVKHVSVRRFASFGLFCRKLVKADDQWVEFSSVYWPEFSALLRDDLGPLRVNEVLTSFDNTGNVCVWPSEEVMAHYCLRNKHTFKGAVCELGGGMTCLAGIMVALSADVTEVLVSDGNDTSIQNVRDVVERNKQRGTFGSTKIWSRVVRWDCESTITSLENHFDVIICADCLFLDQYRVSLVEAISRLLQPDGRALVFAPQRGETLAHFCRLAVQAGLCVAQSRRYDAQVWEVHQQMLKEGKDSYDENIHYPTLVTLTRGQKCHQ